MSQLVQGMIKMEKYRWNENGEGYADRTAGIAIQRVAKEERKNIMAKRRSCRRSVDENIIHDKAVKMRKMTDEQLVYYVEDRVEKARSEGFNKGKSKAALRKIDISAIVEEIGKVKGIGNIKLQEIRVILEQKLEASNG